ncbi:hypothetical protein BSNT_07261 [Bacillus subtilis subsp. natto BEST195]|nr:hypothetical protein BSNT_07261 [Bacillus subtilis subsp. natto BEST195]
MLTLILDRVILLNVADALLRKQAHSGGKINQKNI